MNDFSKPWTPGSSWTPQNAVLSTLNKLFTEARDSVQRNGRFTHDELVAHAVDKYDDLSQRVARDLARRALRDAAKVWIGKHKPKVQKNRVVYNLDTTMLPLGNSTRVMLRFATGDDLYQWLLQRRENLDSQTAAQHVVEAFVFDAREWLHANPGCTFGDYHEQVLRHIRASVLL